MAAVFSTQGAGQFVAALVSLLTTIGFKKEFSTAAKSSECLGDCQIASDKAWRIIVGVGTLPAVFALYYRITIPETPRYTFDVAHDIEKASADATVYMAGESGEGHPDPIKQAQAKKSGPPSINTPHASWSEFFTYFGKWKNGKALLGTTSSWFFLDFAVSRHPVSLEFCCFRDIPTLEPLIVKNISDYSRAILIIKIFSNY